jgi:hypothetical protein
MISTKRTGFLSPFDLHAYLQHSAFCLPNCSVSIFGVSLRTNCHWCPPHERPLLCARLFHLRAVASCHLAWSATIYLRMLYVAAAGQQCPPPLLLCRHGLILLHQERIGGEQNIYCWQASAFSAFFLIWTWMHCWMHCIFLHRHLVA